MFDRIVVFGCYDFGNLLFDSLYVMLQWLFLFDRSFVLFFRFDLYLPQPSPQKSIGMLDPRDTMLIIGSQSA
ncbi:hypothetical protein AB3N58_17570 (plasmid) [Leptospira sp. WS60.C2]